MTLFRFPAHYVTYLKGQQSTALEGVKSKIFFCLYLRYDRCNIIGNRPNLKKIILSCKVELASLSTTFCFICVKMHEAVTFF